MKNRDEDVQGNNETDRQNYWEEITLNAGIRGMWTLQWVVGS
jgi:hypothetical protein